MATSEATKLATEIEKIETVFKIDFSKKRLTNKVLNAINEYNRISILMRHPLLGKSLSDHWQQRTAQAINILSNHQLNEQALLESLRETEALADNLCKTGGEVVKVSPLISARWLFTLHEQVLKNTSINEQPGQYRTKAQSLSYLNRLSGVALITQGDDVQLITKQWRNWANSDPVMCCAPEYRALLLLYYLQIIHPFAQTQSAVSFIMFYGLLKSAGFSHAADAIIVYYAENIEQFAYVFAATANSAHLHQHQQVWFEFFTDAWEWALLALNHSINKILLESHYHASIQKYMDEKQLNSRQQTLLMQLLVNEQVRDRQIMQASSWCRSLYKSLTVRTQERDFKNLCELGFIEMLDKTSFKLTNSF